MYFKLIFACLLSTYLFIEIHGYKARRARIGEVPHQLSLEEIIPNVPIPRHFCAASAVHGSYGLTTGHCLLKMKINPEFIADVRVVAGKYNITGDNPSIQVRRIDFVYTPDEYPPSENLEKISINDVGLFKLDRSLDLNKWVQLVALPKENEDIGKSAELSGWSLIRNRPTVDYCFPLEWLNIQTLTIVSKSRCADSVSSQHLPEAFQYEFPHDHIFCAGPTFKKHPVCIGDTGSGLIKKQFFGRNKIIGVLSYVIRIGVREEEGSSIYTRVSQFLPWISNVISQQ